MSDHLYHCAIFYEFSSSFRFICPNATHIIFTPTASVPSGQYYRSQEVALHSQVPKASLYYTTDGSQPTTQSQRYTKPIHIDTDTTLKVSVYKNRHRLATSTYNYRFVTREDIASSFYLLNIKECLIGYTFRKIIRG